MIHRLADTGIQEFIKKHEQDDPAHLVLQASHYPNIPIKEVAAQIAARKKAKTKLPSWYAAEGLIFPPLLSMEQCSSELTAQYKASLVAGKNMLDLTGGSGVDCFYIGQNFKKVDFVEQNEELCALALHNFTKLGSTHINVHNNTTAEDFLATPKQYDLIYIDPARRGQAGQKVFLIADCQPDLPSLMPKMLQYGRQLLIKLSPMMDISRLIDELELVHFELHILAVQNEVKELLVFLDQNVGVSQKIITINLKTSLKEVERFEFDFIAEKEKERQLGMPEQYIYEPNAAIMKSGGFRSLAEHFSLKKLHPSSQLFSSAELLPLFPGRCFELLRQSSVQKKALKKHLPDMKANLSIRNFPGSVESLKQKLGIKDGGNDYLFATTLANEEKTLLICKKIND